MLNATITACAPIENAPVERLLGAAVHREEGAGEGLALPHHAMKRADLRVDVRTDELVDDVRDGDLQCRALALQYL
jgi:hypothetical protein